MIMPKDITIEATRINNNHLSIQKSTHTALLILQSITNNSPQVFPLGKTIVLWKAEDAAGNISNTTQTVDVVDTTAPKIIPPKDITVEATSLTDNTVSLGNATATDIEQVTITNNAPQVF